MIKKQRRDSNEYKILKDAKADYNALKKNEGLFMRKQTEVAQSILSSSVPDWGDIKLSLVKL